VNKSTKLVKKINQPNIINIKRNYQLTLLLPEI